MVQFSSQSKKMLKKYFFLQQQTLIKPQNPSQFRSYFAEYRSPAPFLGNLFEVNFNSKLHTFYCQKLIYISFRSERISKKEIKPFLQLFLIEFPKATINLQCHAVSLRKLTSINRDIPLFAPFWFHVLKKLVSVNFSIDADRDFYIRCCYCHFEFIWEFSANIFHPQCHILSLIDV